VAISAGAQNKAENLIIITTDGFRWQEVFGEWKNQLQMIPATTKTIALTCIK
jgi:hypothetical protein